jgi:hypothetical protein
MTFIVTSGLENWGVLEEEETNQFENFEGALEEANAYKSAALTQDNEAEVTDEEINAAAGRAKIKINMPSQGTFVITIHPMV